MLQAFDWSIIVLYLIIVFAVGILVSKKASAGADSYFLADRGLPWWVAGISMAATTFAADTPLAVTGIIAAKGLSGNWMWLSWLFLHLAMVFVFAKGWRKSKTLTDAELISLRYSGPEAKVLRSLKAFIYGVVFNAIVLGWVLRAMNKIVEPFFLWREWAPGLVDFVQAYVPSFLMFGAPEEMITTVLLLLMVAIYSSAGGLRGVVLTDVFQFFFALGASYYFASRAYHYIGGFEGLAQKYQSLYGSSEFLRIMPSSDTSWIQDTGLGFGLFLFYLLIQSYANNPADGGGYFMQRLGACKDDKHAQKAAFLFVFIHYFLRVWPWFFMGVAALVIIPLGMEGQVLNGKFAYVAGDREQAYPALMSLLLGEGGLGIMLASLLAAFMSTIDTHLNWGASYVVNDFYSPTRPHASPKQKVKVARLSVFAYMVLAVVVASQIQAITEAWQWLAYLGACIGVPTILRWLWWRVSAMSEIFALSCSLILVMILSFTDWPFEGKMLALAAGGLLSTLAGAYLRPIDPEKAQAFAKLVDPIGVWPTFEGGKNQKAKKALAISVLKIIAVALLFISLLYGASLWLFPKA